MQRIERTSQKQKDTISFGCMLGPYARWFFVGGIGIATLIYAPLISVSSSYAKSIFLALLVVLALGYGAARVFVGTGKLTLPRILIPVTLLIGAMSATVLVRDAGLSAFAAPTLDIYSTAPLIGVMLLFFGFAFMSFTRIHVTHFIRFLVGSTVLLAAFSMLTYLGVSTTPEMLSPENAATFGLAVSAIGLTLLGNMRNKLFEAVLTGVLAPSIIFLLAYGAAPFWMWLVLLGMVLCSLVQQCIAYMRKRTQRQVVATLLIKKYTHASVPLILLVALICIVSALLMPGRLASLSSPSMTYGVQLGYDDTYELVRAAHQMHPLLGLGPGTMDETWHRVRSINTPKDELSKPVSGVSFIGAQFVQYGYISGVLWLTLALLFIYMGFRVRYTPEYYDQKWYWYARALWAGGGVLWLALFLGRGDIALLVTLIGVMGMLSVCYQKLCPSRVYQYKLHRLPGYGRIILSGLLSVCVVMILYGGVRHVVSVGYHQAALYAPGPEAQQLLLDKAFSYMPLVQYQSSIAQTRVDILERRILSLEESADAAAALRSDIEKTVSFVKDVQTQYPDSETVMQISARLYNTLSILGVEGAREEERILREHLVVRDPASPDRLTAYLDALLDLSEAEVMRNILMRSPLPIDDAVRDRYLAEAYILLGEEEEALLRYESLASEMPDEIAVWRMYIFLTVQAEGPRAALAVIDKARTHFPRTAELTVYRALAYTALREHARARTVLEEGLRTNSDSDPLVEALLDEHRRKGIITSMSFVGYEIQNAEEVQTPADLIQE